MALADTVQIATILLEESSLGAYVVGNALGEGDEHRRVGFTPAMFAEAMNAAQQLESLQGRLHAIAEADCNGYRTHDYKWDQAASDRAERNRERLESKVADVLRTYNVKAKLGGDPRGSAIKLQTPNTKRHNTWGGEQDGWAI